MRDDEAGPAGPSTCPACGTELAPALVSCPACHRLVHADELKELAATAAQAEQAGDLTAALAAWRSALELLPPGSKQHQTITARVAELGSRLDTAGPPAAGAGAGAGTGTSGTDSTSAAHGSKWGGGKGAGAAGLGGIALVLWKFKFLLALALTKGKLLLLGLTKASTFYSMLLALWVYWLVFGWWFALGLILSIYIHEMGHVFALHRLGFRASAPMFVPGLGAYVRMQQAPVSAREDAQVGLAGPIWGLGAALAAGTVWLATGVPAWGAIARAGAVINLLNLIPLGPLDGGRAFRALARPDRWLATAALAFMAYLTSEGWLFVVTLVSAFRAGFTTPAPRTDRPALLWYLLLVAALGALTMLPVPVR